MEQLLKILQVETMNVLSESLKTKRRFSLINKVKPVVAPLHLRKRRRVAKIQDFMRTIDKYSDYVFRSHFRMTRNSFKKLTEQIRPFWDELSRRTGRAAGNIEEGLYITLWILSNKCSLRDVADRFGKSISTVYITMMKVCKMICRLAAKYIIWPTTEAEIDAAVVKFNHLRGNESFPNVVGCVDGTHLKIPTPKIDSASYYNRKGYHSIVLQGTCDSDGCFTNIFVGWPGRSHDANVFANSYLGKNLRNGTFKIPSDCHILGDSAYPLETFLMTPYRDNGCLNAVQKHFNYRLSSTRTIIEQAFGNLKQKFRILYDIPFKKMSSIKFIVTGCVVLHNFIIKQGLEVIRPSEIINTDNSNVENTGTEENSIQSAEKRNAIANMLLA